MVERILVRRGWLSRQPADFGRLVLGAFADAASVEPGYNAIKIRDVQALKEFAAEGA